MFIEPQKNDGLGRLSCAEKARGGVPDPSPQRSAGFDCFAEKAMTRVPVAAPNFMNDGEEGISRVADKAVSAVPSSPSPDDAAGLQHCADKAISALPPASTHAETGQGLNATKADLAVPVSASLDKLAEL